MKAVSSYFLILAAICASFTSCSFDNEFDINVPSGDVIRATASVADFNKISVGTRAGESDESKVTDLTMIIFDSTGTLVGEPISNNDGNLVFLIDPKADDPYMLNGEGEVIYIDKSQLTNMSSCKMYMVANCAAEISNVTKEDALLGIKLDVDGIDIPQRGFPMIGSQDGVNLSGNGSSTMLNITMKKLYSKINVRFQLNANQVVKTPSFTLDTWQVVNVPNKVSMGESTGQTVCAEGNNDIVFSSDESNTLSYGYTTITNSESLDNPEYFQFTFYAPEHKVIPNFNRESYENYPTDIPFPDPTDPSQNNRLDERQRYKPCMITSEGKKPMKVIVKGSYKDHHGQVKGVTYSLYLGQNEIDDFFINRNQQIDNVITIKGLTNSTDALDWDPVDPEKGDNISVDHRVEISDKGYYVTFERETLLDSHFEVRPMGVFLSENTNNGKVVITVDDASNTDPRKDIWLRIENSGNTDDHISGVGVRKYFTPALVTNTLKDSKEITLTSDSKIWLYFDENDKNAYDKTLDTDPQNPLPKSREITVVVKFYETVNNVETLKDTQYFTFRQMHLWRVRDITNTRYYDIEYHEEYLHNYVSNDNYGKRKDGMPWGLVNSNGEGLQLSDYMKSFYLKTNFETISNALMESSKPYYDFYITAAEANQTQNYRPYSGKIFSNEIMEKILFEINDNSLYVSDGLLTSDPKSAVDYCYNKNKRSSNGSIITATTVNNTTTYNTDNVKWFLPSIDQIEEIVRSAYQDFEDFQAKWYWSSQPAYDRYNYTYNAQFGLVDKVSGNFYTDDLSNARATMTIYDNGWTSAPSGSDSTNDKTRVGSHTWTSKLWNVDHDYVANSNYDEDELDLGNQPRTAINRIRCVRNSGLVSELTSSTN